MQRDIIKLALEGRPLTASEVRLLATEFKRMDEYLVKAVKVVEEERARSKALADQLSVFQAAGEAVIHKSAHEGFQALLTRDEWSMAEPVWIGKLM